MAWEKLTLHGCRPADVDRFTALLESLNSVSISLLDGADTPILEPGPGETPLWSTSDIEALFNSEKDLDTALSYLQKLEPTLNYSSQTVQDQDWERVCLEHFQPIKYGERLWVYPSWCAEALDTPYTVQLDPGLAFGTGAHPTTALCLEWLDKTSLSNHTLIDFGCGSGILSLAALILGAKHVTAIDIDPQALLATQQNATLNHLSPAQIKIIPPDQLDTPPVNLILANILLSPLLSLKDLFYQQLLEDGTLLISGLYTEQVPVLLADYQKFFELITLYHKNEWACIELKKKLC